MVSILQKINNLAMHNFSCFVSDNSVYWYCYNVLKGFCDDELCTLLTYFFHIN